MDELYSVKDLNDDDLAVIVDFAIRASAMMLLTWQAGESNDGSVSEEERNQLARQMIAQVVDAVPQILHETVIVVAADSLEKVRVIDEFRQELDNL